MTTATRSRCAGHRFPPEVISHAVWLYFRFPLGPRMVEEMLAARGIIVSRETVRQWARKFGIRPLKGHRYTARGVGRSQTTCQSRLHGKGVPKASNSAFSGRL